MKTKLVVINENMLGYIHPEFPTKAGILKSSAIRGATHSWQDGPFELSPTDTVRVASGLDFKAFWVSFDGFNSTEYEFAEA
jgi:hypothetical protein